MKLQCLLYLLCPALTSAFRPSSIGKKIAVNPERRGMSHPSSFAFGTTPSPYFFQQSVIGASCFKPTKLDSLQRLVEDIGSDNNNDPDPRILFVGGKGGVGKTTVSSSLAVALASDYEREQRVLVVSTDPAHSLGDALDVDFRSARGKPMMMTDPLTGGKLYGCEIDPAAALDEFQSNLAAFDVDRLAQSLGISPSLLENLGLREFSGLLKNPPPGLDELVALSNILDSSGENSITSDFDVVVVDTAPTGHTLRMLALPAFLDGLLGKLIELRMKLAGVASTLQGLFGSDEAATRAQTIDDAMDKLEAFRKKISGLRKKLQDSERTNFLVVTIPTKLGVSESVRLISELSSQGVSVTDVVVNQCVGSFAGDESDAAEAVALYYERRKEGQKKWISELRNAIDDVSSSDEFISNGNTGPIALTEVPFFDVELVGAPALAYLGKSAFSENPAFSSLMDDNDSESKFIICGGKGGVGKTTTSSALATSLANVGHKVALISTDPAHSLGDALDMNLSGGALIDVPLYGASPDGSLSVMEIDPAAALKQFKTIVDQLIDTPSDDGDSSSSAAGLGSTIRDLGEIFDTLPAGTDEVVALAKVVELTKKGGFDRIILDTAPTGHTLRMLSTPGFIAELIDRVLIISEKVNSNPTVKMFLAGATKGKDLGSKAEAAKSTLLSFQLQMYDLEDMFANAKQTEFLIVTVATELAVRESIRLLNDLTFEDPDMPIKVRNVVVNQILADDGSDIQDFVSRTRSAQSLSIDELQKSINAAVTEVPYLDTEPRGVFGLKALAAELLREEATVSAA